MFLEAVWQLGVKVVQSSYEADEVIARLAMEQQCPVIRWEISFQRTDCLMPRFRSNDSDFYIFDVEFILLDSLEWEPDYNTDHPTISCQKFNRAKLLQHYGLQRQGRQPPTTLYDRDLRVTQPIV